MTDFGNEAGISSDTKHPKAVSADRNTMLTSSVTGRQLSGT